MAEINVENIKTQMRKGVIEYCVLSILSRGDSYTPEIIAALKESEMIVVEGTLYPILTRQKNQGLLSYRWEESPQGPPRKYYMLTDKVVQHLPSSTTRGRRLASRLERLEGCNIYPPQQKKSPSGDFIFNTPTGSYNQTHAYFLYPLALDCTHLALDFLHPIAFLHNIVLRLSTHQQYHYI